MFKHVSKRKFLSVIMATIFVVGSINPSLYANASTTDTTTTTTTTTATSEKYSWNNVQINGVALFQELYSMNPNLT